MSKKKVIVICGPTGVGKTRCALSLAGRFGGEIVGADAVQVYRGLEIGSAKPTAEERAEVRHHLIDIVHPGEDFDVARYRHTACSVIDDVLARGRMPFVVGGTGLYIKALLNGLFEAPPADPVIRAELRQRAAEVGTPVLHETLGQLDPVSAAKLHPNDTTRILRALEVVMATGRPISSFQQDHGFSDSRYAACKIGLFLERERLYERIDARVDQMMADGFVAEVRGLLAAGFGPDLKAMQSLGYRHMVRHLLGEMDLAAAVSLMKRDHRRYAKRQMTWFRADPAIHWFLPDAVVEMSARISEFVSRLEAGV